MVAESLPAVVRQGLSLALQIKLFIALVLIHPSIPPKRDSGRAGYANRGSPSSQGGKEENLIPILNGCGDISFNLSIDRDKIGKGTIFPC